MLTKTHAWLFVVTGQLTIGGKLIQSLVVGCFYAQGIDPVIQEVNKTVIFANSTDVQRVVMADQLSQ